MLTKTKHLLIGSAVVAAVAAIVACKNTTEAADTANMTPPTTIDEVVQQTPEPQITTSAMDVAQNETPVPAVPEPESSRPVKSLGASSSGLGR